MLRSGPLVLAALASLAVPPSARALPAFARRFNLACGACHIAVPRLNAFGEEFHMNGFKPPGTMWAPLPGSWLERVKDGMAVWTRGEFYEHSDFARGPTPRGSLAVPEHASVYVAGALTPSTSVFMELENTVHETDINKRGDFVNSDTGGIQKGFLMIDLPMLLGLHGGHAGHAGMHHDMGDMDGGMATMGEGLVGHGPMMMIGRVDPSTNFSYAVDRQIFHDVPTDTSERGFLLRLGLQPYAFGAKFFGIFKRGDHTLLPTEPTLYHAEAAPGVDIHGRLFASHLLYQLGFGSDAAPEFTDRFHTFTPYTMLRWDFGDEGGLNGSVSVLGNYGRDAYRVFYLAPAPLPPIPLLRIVPEHRPPPPPGRGTISAQRDLDVWREMVGANLRRGPWDLYGAYSHDQVFDVPDRLAGRFERNAQGLTAELDYRLTHSLLPSIRYDWMKAGGFKSDVIFEPGPRDSQVLHLQMRWYLFEGDDLAKVPIPALLVLSLRDSVNLTPGGSHPFGAWRNGLFLGFDFAF
ncbi:MAG: hypothetical protein E6J70_15790 [Deltaproteobacteria bacterium]|nr:MAG: hypothetical protein E6J70_15790 [Deltaproteobacteria bacterium]